MRPAREETSDELPEVDEREMEGMVTPGRWLQAPSSSGLGMSEGKVRSAAGQLVIL